MKELQVNQLRKICDPNRFEFETTEEVEPLQEIIGQDRAVKALHLGLKIKDDKNRYNIYVVGAPGTGKKSAVEHFLHQISSSEETPPDLCYVHNFDDPYTPHYLRLATGMAVTLKEDMKKLVEMLKEDIPEALESDAYKARKKDIDEKYNQHKNQLFKKLEQEAEKRGFALQRTPIGIKTIPLVDGEPVDQDTYQQLSDQEKEKIEQKQKELQERIQDIIQEVGDIEEERSKETEKVTREAASFVVEPKVNQLKDKYSNYSKVINYLESVKKDLLENVGDFQSGSNQQQLQQQLQKLQMPTGGGDKFKKYDVNVVVDNSECDGAPVMVQDNATYYNLFGKVERRVQFGLMTADFTMIKSGSLHEANGGYLVLNANNLFKYGISWESLKIAIKSGEIRIEDPSHMMGYSATESLKPEPVPLDAKIIIIGNRRIYHLLQRYEEDFKKLFTVKSDFDYEMDRKDTYLDQFASFIKARCDEDPSLLSFHRSGVARIVDYSSECSGDQKKLSARFSDCMTIIQEASFWAKQDNSDYAKAEHVDKAIQEQDYRANRIEEKIQEMIERNQILVDTEGAKVGQVNGLSYIHLGDFAFGKPSRITANVYTGKEGVVNIDREADLSGKVHTKGIMILKGYLGKKFAYDKPLSLSASIAFEQSYSKIDGDSASSTELYAILSSLAEVPIKQGVAVTGSVNQKGEIQPIGGVNEKIYGFYKTCEIKGLTGDQGVIIPDQNVDNLMLKQEVVDAVDRGDFHIWPVSTVAEGVEILTGMKVGKFVDGQYEKGSLFAKVDQTLRTISEKLKEFGEEKKE